MASTPDEDMAVYSCKRKLSRISLNICSLPHLRPEPCSQGRQRIGARIQCRGFTAAYFRDHVVTWRYMALHGVIAVFIFINDCIGPTKNRSNDRWTRDGIGA